MIWSYEKQQMPFIIKLIGTAIFYLQLVPYLLQTIKGVVVGHCEQLVIRHKQERLALQHLPKELTGKWRCNKQG